jgi:hypothetical protein
MIRFRQDHHSSNRHFEQTNPFVIQVVVNAIEALHEVLCLM